jgi:ESX secretion system ATPase EccB
MAQSRRDLFHAHRLMTQRAALALLRGEPDLPDQPLRRLNVATFSSVLVAVIVAALLAILTLLGHGGAATSLGPGSLIIDAQTGTAYVFCEKKADEICPVVNYASARLALKATNPAQQTVSQDSLTHYARGPLIGIPGLPQPLPNANLLVRQPWAVCGRDEITPSGERPVTILAGGVSTGGEPLGHGAVVVRAGRKYWVLWNGQRMFTPRPELTALGTPSEPVTVSVALLDSVPQGPNLVPPVIPGAGAPAPGPPGRGVVGQVYKVTGVGASAQFYVRLSDGLARITQTQATLLEAKKNAPQQAQLSLSQVTGNLSRTTFSSRGLPGHVPHFAQIGTSSTICAVYSLSDPDGKTAAQIVLGGRMPNGGLPVTAPGGVSRIVLPPGDGALVGVAPGGLTHQGSPAIYFLVANGHRYGLASKGVASWLGYQLASKSVQLPIGVLDLIPVGPSLDPAVVRRPVAAGG